MQYGLVGANLEVNLSTGEIHRAEVDKTVRHMYLGGRGTNTRFFWDRVPPETDPYSPDNLMIFPRRIFRPIPAWGDSGERP